MPGKRRRVVAIPAQRDRVLRKNAEHAVRLTSQRLAAQPREDAPLSATVLRPGSVQRVNAVHEEMDDEAGALSTW